MRSSVVAVGSTCSVRTSLSNVTARRSVSPMPYWPASARRILASTSLAVRQQLGRAVARLRLRVAGGQREREQCDEYCDADHGSSPQRSMLDVADSIWSAAVITLAFIS